MSAAHLERVRTGAAVAALVLAGLSRGDALVLAALLAVTAWRLTALALIPALIASSWRWGSTSLDALAGAQAVLGPAGIVGPATAASASWLAAIAILLSVPAHVGGMRDRNWAPGAPDVPSGWLSSFVGGNGVPGRAPGAPNPLISSVAVGAAAAAVVAGPGPGGDLWVRVVATVVVSALALTIARWRAGRPGLSRAIVVVAVATAVGALVAVIPNAPGWSGTIDAQALGQGAILTVAVGVLVTVGRLSWAAMGQREA